MQFNWPRSKRIIRLKISSSACSSGNPSLKLAFSSDKLAYLTKQQSASMFILLYSGERGSREPQLLSLNTRGVLI